MRQLPSPALSLLLLGALAACSADFKSGDDSADGADGAVLVGDDAQVGDWLLRCQHGVSTGNVLFGQAVQAKMRRAGVRRPWVGIRQRVAA